LSNESSDSGPSRHGGPTGVRREIAIQNPNGYAEVRARVVRPWLENVLRELAPDADSLTVRFVGDRAMRELNRTYRHLDTSTDVLSFPGDLPAADDSGVAPDAAEADPFPGAFDGDELDDEGAHLGDVVISLPYARRQAAGLGHDLDQELRTLMLHGVLHCLGYDHEVDDGAMERRETALRARYVYAWSAPSGGVPAGSAAS
jgi:probable rRNA maturation factor